MRFEFVTATRIVFGPGALREGGRAIVDVVGDRPSGGAERRALVVTGARGRGAGPLVDLLGEQGFATTTFAVAGEPTIEMARQGAEQAREARCCLVVGMGGGSAIDAGKAIAALAANPGDPLDYLEVVGRGRPLVEPSVPYVAIPTTAGTGAEVTRNAVLASPEHGVKASLRSLHMLPRLAIVDPELTHSLPPAVTAATGLDALTQLIEPFVSVRANPMTDAICREGIARAARSLRRAYRDGTDAAAREDMSLASLFGGLALANAGLGAVHGFAGPIGGAFSAPHGAVCATLLPHVMAANVRSLRQTEASAPTLQRYHEIAGMVTGKPSAQAEDGIEWARQLVHDLRIPRLGEYGIATSDVDELVAKAQAASSMRGNPVSLGPEELRGVLSSAI
ncbi:MAG: iron-containing alcohol dehydrogenase [Planctomycetes bacterium]|nr:iron-containing alcohol dehydrogenase [Planctomycetota bacterium]